MRNWNIPSTLFAAFCIAAPALSIAVPHPSALARPPRILSIPLPPIPVVSRILPPIPVPSLPTAARAPSKEGFKVPAARRSVTNATGDVDPEVYFGQLQYTIQKYKHSFQLPFSVSDVSKKVK
jgi:hypothetical protein